MTAPPVPKGLSRRSATIWRALMEEHAFERHELATLQRSFEWLDRSDALLAAADAAGDPRERAGLLKQAMDASTCGWRFWRTLRFVDPATKRRPGRPPGDEWRAQREHGELRRKAGQTMPTKYRGADVPDVKAEVIAILLAGWSAKPPPGVPLGPHGFGGGLLELCVTGGPGTGGLWRQYGAMLRERARAWGWTPHYVGPEGRRRFYGEALAWEADRGEPNVRVALALHADNRDDDSDDDGPEVGAA